MKNLSEINEKINTLKTARDILQHEYSRSELLTAIHQLDKYVKEYQERQFSLLKKHS